jgi:4-carboxymuconolactone decarboxylase
MKSLTGLMCLSLCASTLTLAIPGSAAAEGPTRKDVQMVAPALDKYTEDRLLGDVWNRPGLSRRDRSLATLAALIGRNQTIALPQHLKLALDHGVKPDEDFGDRHPSGVLCRLGERDGGRCGDKRRVRGAQRRT